MLEISEQPCFALECLAQHWGASQNLFERRARIQALVGDFVDGTHAAMPDWAPDQVTSLQQRSSAKWHHGDHTLPRISQITTGWGSGRRRSRRLAALAVGRMRRPARTPCRLAPARRG